MYKELQGKLAFISGGTQGIGKAIAIAMAQSGVHLGLGYQRNRQEAEKTLKEIQNLGGKAILCPGTLGTAEKAQKALSPLQSYDQPLSILIANAAFGVTGQLHQSTEKHLEKTFQESSFSLIYLLQEALKKGLNLGGTIIAISSLGGTRVLPSYGPMGAAKSSLEGMIRTLAHELGPKKITANLITPGPIKTNSSSKIPGFQQRLAHFEKKSPLGKRLDPKDISKTALFLCSEGAQMITGQNIIIDGGYSLEI